FGVKLLGSKANSGTATRRGNNGSGIVDGDAVVLPVGSTDGATLVCFDKRTGKVLWKSGDDEAAYSSPMLATLAGVKQIVYLSADSLAGYDPKTGQLKWSQPGFGQGRKDYSSTIVAGKNLLVLTEDGTLLLLAANPSKYTELGRAQVCGNTWSFPAFADGKLYVRDGRQLACYNLLSTN